MAPLARFNTFFLLLFATYFWRFARRTCVIATFTRVKYELDHYYFFSSFMLEKNSKIFFLFGVLEAFFRLIHPFMPFLSEELWQRLHDAIGDGSLLFLFVLIFFVFLTTLARTHPSWRYVTRKLQTFPNRRKTGWGFRKFVTLLIKFLLLFSENLVNPSDW